MNHTEAIIKLIERNKSFVRKNGTSNYSRETDTIINALLSYVKNIDSRLSELEKSKKNMNILFLLLGIPDELKNIDPEFLERYLNNDVVSRIHLSCGGDPEEYNITLNSILIAYNSAQRRIKEEYEMFLFFKQNTPEALINSLSKCFPKQITWLKKNYSESEIIEEIKRSIYYNYD